MKLVMIKFIPFGLLVLGFNPTASVFQETLGYFPFVIAAIMCLFLFSPEIAFTLIPPFRRFVKTDILRYKEAVIAKTLVWYAPFVFGRSIIGLSLFEISLGKDINSNVYWLLFALASGYPISKLMSNLVKLYKNDE